jgi:hypothetical protein
MFAFNNVMPITLTQRSSAPWHHCGIRQCAERQSPSQSCLLPFHHSLRRRLMLPASLKQIILFVILDYSCVARSMRDTNIGPQVVNAEVSVKNALTSDAARSLPAASGPRTNFLARR